LFATVEDAAEVKLSGNLAVPRVHAKLATFVGCPPTNQSLINAAAAAARNYVNNTYSYILGISGGSPRHTTWFGTYTVSRRSTVRIHFQSISSSQFSNFTYDCTCTRNGTFAYVCAYILQS